VFTRIDRYVSGGFLIRLIGALFLMAFLYVSFDILKRLDDLQGEAAGEALGALTTYYARVLPLFLLELVPGLVLIAAGMVVVKMAAARELLALKASGTSLYRVVAPIFFWALLLSAAVFVLRERLGPESAEQGALIRHILNDPLESHLLLSDDGFSRKVFVGQYDFADESMERILVMETDPEDGHIRKTWRAERGHWEEPGEMVLLNVIVQEFGGPGNSPIREVNAAGKVVLETSLSPLDMLEAADESSDSPASFQTLGELRRYARMYPGVLHFQVSYHGRLASFFSPLVLLLVGIPCLVGFERSVNSRLLGTIIGIFLAAGLYALTFVFNSMGATGTLNPVAACWLPQVVGGAAGLWLFESMLT
jgi:lipopolysaccharide export LptBFGC system permease protein LptF